MLLCVILRNPEITSREKLPLQVVQLDVNDDMSVKEAIDKIEGE
jgi:hypothetical protein